MSKLNIFKTSKMKLFLLVSSAVFIISGALVTSIILMVLGMANKSTSYEVQIEKFDLSTQNILSSYTMKIQEVTQVPEMYKEDLKEIVQNTFQGRYGEDGSEATFQFIREMNPDFDSSLYRDVMVLISSGRDEFKLGQDRKLEICADYKYYYSKPLNRFILSFIGYPSDGIASLCRIITDERTNSVFSKGVQEKFNLRS